ncbi:MAG: hypothetical protein AABY74_06235 [Planctomycetota bacterium]
MPALDVKLLLMATVAIKREYEVNVLADACVPLPSESVTIIMPKKKKKLKREQKRALKQALESPAKPTDGDNNQSQARSD